MRLGRVSSFIVCCALVAAGGAACFGGGSSDSSAPDANKIPTATLPATLPETKVLSSSAVSAAGASSYTVKDGDTLAGIAARFGVSLDDLRTANPTIDASALSIGQTVHLPQTSEVPGAAPTPTATTVAPTTTSASPTTTSASPTTEATQATAATDTPEPVATPSSDTPTAGAVGTATPSSLGQTYVVQEGDFPAKIAEKFGISLDDLLAANPGIDPTNLQIGQVLIIPPKPAG